MKFAFAPESKPLEGYTIKRAIHRGGFGEVYYALSDAGKEVALKLLRQNMEVELRGVSQCLNLKHTHLVNLFDIKTDEEGDHWIIMEYVAGKTLEEVLHSYPNGMPIERVRHFLKQICQGLEFLHDRGIVHRDMKPANLFVEDDLIKIGDIGLSKFITQSRRSAQTQSVGTVYYMAPEVAHGRYGHEVDVYALGIILFELLTGHVPFEGESTGEILMKHLTEKPDLTPLPEAFRGVVGRALEKDPQNRTASVDQVWAEFEVAAGNSQASIQEPIEIPESSFKPVVMGDLNIDSTQPTVHEAELDFEVDPAAKHDPHDDGIYAPESRRKRPGDSFPPTPKPGKTKQDYTQQAKQQARQNGHRHPQAARPHAPHASKDKPVVDSISEWFNAQHVAVQVAVVLVGSYLVLQVGIPLLPVILILTIPCALIYACYAVFCAMTDQDLPKPFNHKSANLHRGEPPSSNQTSPHEQPEPTWEEQSKKFWKQVAEDSPHARKFRNRWREKKKKWSNKEILRNTPPETVRSIGFVQKMTELSGSLALSAFYVAIFSVLFLLFDSGMDFSQNLTYMFYLEVTCLLSIWAVLITSKLSEGTSLSSVARRCLLLPSVLVVGTLVWAISNHLMVTPDFDITRDVIGGAVFSNVGGEQLYDVQKTPSLVGYVVFFLGFLFLRRWWPLCDSYRKHRMRINSILWTAILAVVWVSLFAFPIELALFWAVVNSTVLQLVSPWTPPAERLIIEERS